MAGRRLAHFVTRHTNSYSQFCCKIALTPVLAFCGGIYCSLLRRMSMHLARILVLLLLMPTCFAAQSSNGNTPLSTKKNPAAAPQSAKKHRKASKANIPQAAEQKPNDGDLCFVMRTYRAERVAPGSDETRMKAYSECLSSPVAVSRP
jgi:hypothetical protein